MASRPDLQRQCVALEHEPHAQLDVALASLARNAGKVGARGIRFNPPQVGVVDEIERFRPQLQSARSGEGEVLEESEASLHLPRIDDDVPRGVAESTSSWRPEGRRIEGFGAGSGVELADEARKRAQLLHRP